MASRKDVAAAAGVSVRTVSNVVSGFQHVAPDTRERVLKAIADLSYHPSDVARTLKMGRSGLVGMMLPEIDVPYFAEITRAFVEEAANCGMTIVVAQTDRSRDRELAWVDRAARGSMYDGLILSPLNLTSKDLQSIRDTIPVAILGEEKIHGFDRVAVNGAAAAYDAVAHLIASGCRRIAAIGTEEASHGTSGERFSGYRAALDDVGLAFDPSLAAAVDRYSRPDGYLAMNAIMDRGGQPDAVFCFSDALALGALRAIIESGLRVPEDIQVVGFDDIEDGRYSTPSLTTIRPDKRWLAHTAFSRLVKRIEGAALEPETITAPFELVIRESAPEYR